jgi:hypothetical protein
MAFNPDAHLPTSGFNPDNFLPKNADYQGVAGNLQSPAWVDQFNKLYDAGRFDEAKALAAQNGPIPFDKTDKRPKYAPDSIQQKVWDAADWASRQPANLGGGLLKGAINVGTAIPDYIDQPKRSLEQLIDPNSKTIHQKRMEQVDQFNRQILGADPSEGVTKTGKFIGDLAGTSGAGGILAKWLLGVAPKAIPMAEALSSGGMSSGELSGLSGMGTKILGGALSGGASAGMVDPESAGTGAAIGGALPVVGQIPGLLSDASRKLMWSALKPTLAVQKSGNADKAVETLLRYGINPTAGGVEKMRSMIGDLNNQISDKIANSGATVSRNDVLNALSDVRGKFGNQVAPTSDLNAIDNVAQDFASHPNIQTNHIPVQLAQSLKQGTYKTLSGKFGEVGSASTEAQKALARALKEGIANSVPEVGALNATESELINAANVSERRALMDMNKNPLGLSTLAHNPATMAMSIADKSALIKALLARSSNSLSNEASYLGRALPQPTTNVLLSILSASGNQPDNQQLINAILANQGAQ